jgi:signal transduction histidine kinase
MMPHCTESQIGHVGGASTAIGSKSAAIALALVGTAGLGYVDYITGTKVGISAFYLLPTTLVTWTASRKAGFWMANVCGLVWWVTNYAGGMDHSHPLFLAWNALMLWCCFAVVVFLVAAFRASQEHLEEAVAKRTCALKEEIALRQRLEHSKLQAERLAVAGTMAAQLAHEIRNPLGSITLNLDLVSKEIDRLAGSGAGAPEESRTLIAEMRDEVRRVQGVLSNYLAFTRLPKPNRGLLNLNELLEQKLPFMQAAFEKSQVEAVHRFDPLLPAILADPEQIWQVLLNLVQNALDAMPEGGLLTFATGRIGIDAILQVGDTGAGMTEDQAQNIFRPFFSTKTRGTGIGLAIAQQIITEHQGHIECATVRGKGTTFTICLPLTRADGGVNVASAHAIEGIAV